MFSETHPRDPLPFLLAVALRASPPPRPGTQSARPALGRICPGCCGLRTWAAPVPFRLRLPAGFTLTHPVLPSIPSVWLQLLLRCSAPTQPLSARCLLPSCSSSSGPSPTPTSALSQCKGLGRGDGRGSRWPDRRTCKVESIPTSSEFSKDQFEGVTSAQTKHRKTHTLKLTSMYLRTTCAHTILMYSHRPAHSTHACRVCSCTLKHTCTLITHATITNIPTHPHGHTCTCMCTCHHTHPHGCSLLHKDTHIHEHTHLTPIHKHTDVSSTIYFH